MDLGSEKRHATPPVIGRLLGAPQTFEFYQAVRLLERERLGRTASPSELTPAQRLAPLGHLGPPELESVRIRGIATLNFPPSPICHAEQKYDDVDGLPTQVELSVAFLSLFGSQGALPRHYTEQIIERVRAADESLLEFLNLFQHRALSLLFRAWLKYRLSPSVEIGRLRDPNAGLDQTTRLLMSLCGLGTELLVSQSRIDPDFVAYYSGNLSRGTTRSESLRNVLGDYFSIPVEVQEFVGRWIRLPLDSQSHLQNSPRANSQLGYNTVSGSRVFDQTSTVRLRIGPLSRQTFQRFLPGSEDYLKLCEIIKYMLGVEFDFEIQLILKAEDVPVARLGDDANAPRLGVDFWMNSRPVTHDVDDVLFRPTIQPQGEIY